LPEPWIPAQAATDGRDMTRAAYGDGSVYQRASDRKWVATYTCDGKRRVVYGDTRSEALKKRREARARHARGLRPVEARDSFNSVAERWEKVYSRTLNLTVESRQNYIDVLRLHVVPVIGSMPIASITPSDVASVMIRMQDKGYSPSYRHQAHKAISHVFRMALSDGKVTMNPTRSIPAPRGTVKQKVVPSRDVVIEMICLAPDERMRTFLVIAAHTGLRISEILSLRWTDVNAQTRSVSTDAGGPAQGLEDRTEPREVGCLLVGYRERLDHHQRHRHPDGRPQLAQAVQAVRRRRRSRCDTALPAARLRHPYARRGRANASGLGPDGPLVNADHGDDL
jgi:integrase